MVLRSSSFAFFLALAAGCAAPSAESADEDTASSDSALTSTSLRAETALDRVRILDPQTGVLEVEYVPPVGAPGYDHRVAFEPMAIGSSNVAAELAIAGDFPSSATVVVTNEAFEPLAVARTVRAESGLSEASIPVPPGGGRRLVLVRDLKWVKPMTFVVRFVGP